MKLVSKLLILISLSITSLAQVAVKPVIVPHVTFVDATGSPCAGCKLYTDAAGTTTPLATYTDSTGTSQNTNPIVLDVAGGANINVGPNSYKFILKDTSGSTIWTVDQVSATVFQTDSTNNGSQTLLNLIPGPNVSITNSGGNVTIGTTGLLVTAPTGNQVVVQPSGTTFSINSFESVLYADQFPGADAGAQINAADAQLGSSPGTIIYSAATVATASTNVILSANHKLVLQSPISWTATITLPDNSSGQDISCPGLQTLSYGSASIWIAGNGISNASFHDCNITSTITSGTLDTVASFLQATNVTVSNNSVANVALVVFGSTATKSTCTDGSQCQYPNVTADNSSSQIKVSGNHGTAAGGEFIFLNYTNGATITGNVADGYYDSVVWWGGDSCIAGCTVGGNGALANARKTTNLTISDNVFTSSVNACIWGSMGQYLTISGNNCVGDIAGTDVGIDLEGTWDSTVSHNTVSGYSNGDLATFFLTTRVSFIGNSATGVSGAHTLISTHNSTNVPDGLMQTFSGNDLNCTDTAVCLTSFQAAEIYNITGNHFHNTMLTMNGLNLSNLFITGNDLSFDLAASHGILATTSSISALSANGQVVIRNNTILSSATQASGKQAIFTSGADANHASNIRVEGNVVGGSSAFPVGLECDAASTNAGIATNCTLLNNSISGTVVTSNGSSGAPVYVYPGPQTITVAGCAITAGAIGNSCTATMTFPIAQPDTNYVVTGCTVLSPPVDGDVVIGASATKTTTTVNLTEIALSTANTGRGTIQCLITHP